VGKKLAYLILCIFLVFVVVGCKKKAAGPKVETIAGVTYVHNQATPLHPEKMVSFEEEFTFKEKDETGEIRLFKPGSFAVDNQDRVYIEDDSDMAIKVFNAQGKFLRSIGRQGSGPGEFAGIDEVIPLPDGRLLVTDFEVRRTSFFSPDGQFLTSFQWKKDYRRVHLVTNFTYIVDENVFSKDKNELWIKMIEFNGEEKLSLGKFTYPEFKRIQAGSGAIAMSVPWSPASVFAGDEKRRWLYHCPTDKYLIEVYDGQGKLFRKIDRPYEPVTVTSEDINKIKARYTRKPDSPAARIFQQMELPKVKPVANRLLVDSDDNLWVQTSEVKKEGEKEFTAFDIFNPAGFYDTRVWVDISPDRFANGKMYRMAEDAETGLRQVKRYRVVWKEVRHPSADHPGGGGTLS
jgi:hypothetical protein